MQNECADLEKLAKAQQTEDAALLAAETELQRVLRSINSLPDDTASIKDASGNPLDRNAVKRVLATLAKQCEEYDTNALTTIESESVLFSASFLKSELNLLGKALESYDFEAAQAVIEKMRGLVAGYTVET